MIYPPGGSLLFAGYLDEPSKNALEMTLSGKTGEKPVDYGRLYRD
jgi:hypothetical protein